MLKTLGYAISTISVVLLAIPGWKAALEQPILFVALILGILTSILGMFMRWLSFLRDQKAKATADAKTDQALAAVSPAGSARSARNSFT